MFKKLLITTLLILCVFSVSCTSKLESVKTNINDKNLEVAIEDYQKLKEDEKAQVDEMVKGLIDEQYQLFYDKKISGVDSMTEVLKLKKFDGVSSYAEEVKDKISVLNASREAFSSASSSESNGNVDMAIRGYKEVDKSDTENYEIAQKKITELQVILDEENKKQLEKQMAENNKYVITSTSIVPNLFDLYDGIQVFIQNNSDTPVKEVKLGVFIYDKNGLPLKVSALAGGNIYMEIKETNANIMPGEVFGADKVINTYLDYGTVGYVKASLIEVVDYNGKKWTNTAHSQWYLDNYDKKYQE